MMQVENDLLRAFYFLGGVAATLMIATGFVITVEKRPVETRGESLVDTVALASTLGLLEAVVAYLAANRLVPPCADHAALELWAFAGVWLAALAHALVACGVCRARAWAVQGAALAVLCVLAVVANWATTGATTFASLARGQAGVAGVDAALIVTGAAAAIFSWRLHRKALAHPAPLALPRRAA